MKDNRKGYRVPSTVYVGIGARLDDIQHERDMSCEDIANIAGIDRKIVYAVKNNKNVTLKSLVAIANVLDVSLDWLVFGKERNGKEA